MTMIEIFSTESVYYIQYDRLLHPPYAIPCYSWRRITSHTEYEITKVFQEVSKDVGFLDIFLKVFKAT